MAADHPRAFDVARGIAVREHWILGSLCAAVLLAAAVLRVDGARVDGERVVVPGVGIALPSACWSRRWFDVACPGCGLTRGLIAVMHGDVAAAWSYNPAVFVLLPMLVQQVVYRFAHLYRARRSRDLPVGRSGAWLLGIFIAALVVQWIIRR